MLNIPMNLKITNSLNIEVEGPLDGRTVKDFTKDATGAIENTEANEVVFIFGKDAYVNSMGLSGIVHLWELCKNNNKSVTVYANEHISHLMHLSRLDQVLNIKTFVEVPAHHT